MTGAQGLRRRVTLREMSRRDEWRKVLDREVERWSAMSAERLIAELREMRNYEIQYDSKKYQVEVEILENTAEYVHVSVAVDDGSLPSSLRPESRSFIRKITSRQS